MIWLLDLADDHRAAIRYDLLRHGYRLEWMGTPRLPWGDALAIVAMQPPTQSAVFRELHPDEYDMTREVQILEVLAVIMQTANIQRGNPSGAKSSTFPRTFSDLFAKQQKAPKASEEEILAGIKQWQELLGTE
jgi:hypothetical protein